MTESSKEQTKHEYYKCESHRVSKIFHFKVNLSELKMVSHLILAFSLAVQLYLSQSSIEANSKPFQKSPCWMCNVTHCKQCVASQWTPWNQCSAPCGKNGYQSRTRLVHPLPSCGETGSCRDLTTKEWRPCNRFCHNGGTPDRWACRCPLNYTGDCCETGLCS